MEKLIPYNMVYGRFIPNPQSIIYLALSEYSYIQPVASQISERICTYLFGVMASNNIDITISKEKAEMILFTESNNQ